MNRRNLFLLIILIIFSFKAFSEANYKCFAESTNGGKKIELVEFYFPKSGDTGVHAGVEISIYWKSGADRTVIGVDERVVYRFDGSGGFAVNRGMYFDAELAPVEGSDWIRGIMARKAQWMYTIECIKVKIN